jgi:WYL_2, Sm-like SH3 beta-barrel fold
MKKLHNVVDTRNEIVKCLLTGPTLVLFKKKDGSTRKMICTLHPKLLPPTKEKLHNMAHNPDRESRTISAYDLENLGWRSFIVENVRFFEQLKPSGEKK